MLVFKDIISEDEMFNDTYNYELVDEVMYRVVGKHVTIRENGNFDIGANPSAEEPVETIDDSENVQSGINVVLHMSLQPTHFNDKKSFMNNMKSYLKLLKGKSTVSEGKSIDDAAFQSNITNFFKRKLANFSNLEFFQGCSCNADAMVAIMDYEDVDGEEMPVLYFLKHGLSEHKY